MKVYETQLTRVHRMSALVGSAAGTALGLHLSVPYPQSFGVELVVYFGIMGGMAGLFGAIFSQLTITFLRRQLGRD